MTADEMRRETLDELFSLTGTAAIVTGAANGLGYAMSEVLASCGAQVAMLDVDAEGVEAAASRLVASGLRARAVTVDAGDRATLSSAVACAAEEAGRLDIVVANAGITAGPGPLHPDGRMEAVDPERWDRVLAVNLTGVFTTIRAALPALRAAGGGRVIVTASIAGLGGERHVGYAYAATKAAVVNLVRQAALELAEYDIRVNGIAPGPFRTAIAARRPDREELEADLVSDVALGRMAEPHEIRGLALLLASPSSSYITGAVIPIDGGATAVSPG